MIIRIELVDEDGKAIAKVEHNAYHPLTWKAEEKIIGNLPRESDNPSTGLYEFHGFAFQPYVRVVRPNGA